MKYGVTCPQAGPEGVFGALNVRHTCVGEEENINTITKHKSRDEEVFVGAKCANIKVGYTEVMGGVRGAGVRKYMRVKRVRELQESRVL
jgi:hypothetical protein